MRLNEFLKGKKSICTIFTDRFGDAYDYIFGCENYDVYIEVTYGNREVIPALTPENYENVVGSVIAMRINDWRKMANAMNTIYDVADPHEQIETNHLYNSNDVDMKTKTDSEAVFNDAEMQPDSKGEENGRRTSQINESTIVRKSGSITDIPEVVRKEMSLRLLEWKKSIIFAIIKEITLSIY